MCICVSEGENVRASGSFNVRQCAKVWERETLSNASRRVYECLWAGESQQGSVRGEVTCMNEREKVVYVWEGKFVWDCACEAPIFMFERMCVRVLVGKMWGSLMCMWERICVRVFVGKMWGSVSSRESEKVCESDCDGEQVWVKGSTCVSDSMRLLEWRES